MSFYYPVTNIQGSSTYNRVLTGETQYIACGTVGSNDSSSESDVKIKASHSGTFSKLHVAMGANSFTTANCYVRFRKNGADGNQNVTVPAGTTGTFEDVSNTDSVTDGDDYNWKISADSGGSGQADFERVVTYWEASSGYTLQYAFSPFLTSGITAASTVRYGSITGGEDLSTTEATTVFKARTAVTISHLGINVKTNTRISASLLKFRKNGADGNQSVLVLAGTTGIYRDTTNTDSVSVDDEINYYLITGAGSGTFLPSMIFSTAISSNGDIDIPTFDCQGYTRTASATARNFNVGGQLTVEVSANDNAIPARCDAIVKNFVVKNSANSYTGDLNSNFRLNLQNKLSNPMTAATTGYFENTGSQAIISTDTYQYLYSGGTSGTAVLNYYSVTYGPVPSVASERSMAIWI